MHGVRAAGAQETGCFGHDLAFGAVALHGEHRLAEDHVGAGVVESGGGGVGGDRPVGRGEEVVEPGAGCRVGVDAEVSPRPAGEDGAGGDAEAGREFDDSAAGDVRLVEQPVGGFAAAGAQHLLARTREQPVAADFVRGAVGAGQVSGHGGNLLKKFLRLA